MTTYERVEDLLHRNFSFLLTELSEQQIKKLADHCLIWVIQGENFTSRSDRQIITILERCLSSLLQRFMRNEWSDID